MENREKWRKLVAKSSVVPKRPYNDDDDDDADCTAKEPIITILRVNSYDIVGEEYVKITQLKIHSGVSGTHQTCRISAQKKSD